MEINPKIKKLELEQKQKDLIKLVEMQRSLEKLNQEI